MGEWKPIEKLDIPPFDTGEWYRDVARVLVVCGEYSWVQIATYGYTQKGKGRWQDQHGRICHPTHYMPLPDPPTT